MTSTLSRVFLSNLYLVLTAIFLAACYIRRKRQSSPLSLYFDKKSNFMSEFAEKSKIKTFVYTPHMLCVTAFTHLFTFISMETLYKNIFKPHVEKELFKA